MAAAALRRVITLTLAFAAGAADAHSEAGALHWVFEPWVIGCLGVSALWYAAGAMRLWRQAGTGRGLPPRAACAFAAGWLALVGALVSPLDALGARLFSAHMLQHELLMVVAAPLLVLARPFAAWTWGMPMAGRRALQRITHGATFHAAWRWLTSTSTAWLLHGAALWLWHLPSWFDAALADDALHVLQHCSFLGSALLFWWAVLRPAPPTAIGRSLLSLFSTMLHTGALGALLTLAPTVWYAGYRDDAPLYGLDALADQQLGGLLMWVPAGLAYCVVALLLVWRLLAKEPAAHRTALRRTTTAA